MCRQSKRCNAKMTAITTFVILFTFTFTYASVFPSRHSKNTAMMDNPRNFVSMSFEALASIAQSFSEWIALLASYCLTVSCCLLESFSVVLVTVWENTVVILSNLRMFILMIFETLASIRYWENICAMVQNIYWFIAKIFEALENVAHVCLKCIALLASFCHTVSTVWLLFWNSVVIILDNLRMFTSMIIETLTSIKKYWENTSSILESLQWLISTIFEASSKFARGYLEWIYVLAPYFHTVSCYLSKWFSKGAINLMIHWKNFALLFTVLCGAVMIWRCYFRAVAQGHIHGKMPAAKWYWEENGNVWCLYDKDHSGRNLQVMIEQAFLDGLARNRTEDTFNFTVKGQNYRLVFNSERDMYQENLQYGTKRKVERRPEKPVLSGVFKRFTESSLPELPSHWSSMPANSSYQRVTLGSFSWEFKKVARIFKASMTHVKIVKIDRMQNPVRWKKYQRKKDYMKKMAHGIEQGVNEKGLFHGTSPNAVIAICEESFDCRLSGKNGTSYGKGNYFAVQASLSHCYAEVDTDSTQSMFFAKVLVGSYVRGNCTYNRPPQRQPSNGAGAPYYDSCVDDVSNPTMFITFDNDQSYPEYIIQYKS